MPHYCPDCIIEMIPDKKKLGRGSRNWFICPKCGYRKKKWQAIEDEKKDLNFYYEVIEMNKSGGKYKNLEEIEFNLNNYIMSNYPPGAKYDPRAPFNEVEPNISISTGKNYIDVDDGNNVLTIDEYDLVNFILEMEEDIYEIKDVRLDHSTIEIEDVTGKIIFLDEEEIINYFYEKFYL